MGRLDRELAARIPRGGVTISTDRDFDLTDAERDSVLRAALEMLEAKENTKTIPGSDRILRVDRTGRRRFVVRVVDEVANAGVRRA